MNFDKTTYPPKREEKNKDGENVYHYEIDPTAKNMNMNTAGNQKTLEMTHQLASAGKKTNGIVLGITNKLNFVCNYDMADQTIESSKFDVASGDVTFEGTLSRFCLLDIILRPARIKILFFFSKMFLAKQIYMKYSLYYISIVLFSFTIGYWYCAL